MSQPTRPSVRWRPALLVCSGAAIVILVIWMWPETQRQQRYLRTAGTLLVTGFLLFLWLMFFSRTRWRTRLRVVAAFFLAAVAIASTFHIRGVNGDLVPILEPRWKSKQTFTAEERPSRGRTNTPARVNFGEFTQFYGPHRNAVLPGPDLETNWTEHPPRLLWRQPVGAAWSGFSVKDGLAVTMEQRGDKECVVACEGLTGKTVWVHEDPVQYSTTIAGEGPRSTPTIKNDRVFTFGATGLLNCLDLSSGAVIWSRDARKENEAPLPDWGFASSPLVIDGQVVVCVGSNEGGSLSAYSETDGKPLWVETKYGADYSSPIEAVLLGKRQILAFTRSGIAGRGLDPRDQISWLYSWPGGHPHITPPLLVSSNLIVASTGYGTGTELVRLAHDGEDWKASRVWKSIGIKSKFGPLFIVQDHLYGLDDGILACLDLETGQRKWKDGRYGHSQGLLVGGHLLISTEKGEIVLVQPSPDGLVELSRFRVFDGKTWNPPALAGEYLFLRNDKEAACVQLQRQKRA